MSQTTHFSPTLLLLLVLLAACGLLERDYPRISMACATTGARLADAAATDQAIEANLAGVGWVLKVRGVPKGSGAH